MAINIWTQCNGVNHIVPLNENAWRLIEAQEISSTRKLVDSLEEQILLESMIESIKPAVITSLLGYHKLLYSAFRYPPLKYGSRFGTKTEPSIWYGSLDLSAAMAEKAFYKFNFLRASKAKYSIVEERLTAFSAHIKTNRGVRLNESPFVTYRDMISSPLSYEATQQLGASMRMDKINAFKFMSARDPDQGINIAIFSPKAFFHKHPDPKSFQSWECIAHYDQIEFVRSHFMITGTKSFSIHEFMVNGVLPFPAN